ncbi:hypothetical protein RJ035_000157 [Blastomyces gilchristii]
MSEDDLLQRNKSLSAIASRPGVLGALARFWLRSYAADYVSLIVLVVGWILIQIFVRPFYRMFTLDNVSIQFPFAEVERVPVCEFNNFMCSAGTTTPIKAVVAHIWSIIYAGVMPLIIIIVWAVIIRPETHFTHVSVLGLLVTLALTSFLTDIIKNAVGQLHVFQPRTGLARFLFSLSPLLGALLIAMSRLADYRHDVYDVAVGSLLGISVAYFTYRRYYPPLQSVHCDTPYSRSEIPPEGFHRVARDEEERLFSGRVARGPNGEYGDDGYQMRGMETGRA